MGTRVLKLRAYSQSHLQTMGTHRNQTLGSYLPLLQQAYHVQQILVCMLDKQ